MSADKNELYIQLFQNIEAVLDQKADEIANMANMAALIHDTLKPHWTGFYRVMGNQLILGPFQGPVACTRIAFDKGVCGNAWKQAKTILVDNVHEYPGHIACSALSNAEIVVPVIKNGVVTALLDVDSEHFAAFDATDEDWLEKIVKLLP
jgi:GAF domain-containing protein